MFPVGTVPVAALHDMTTLIVFRLVAHVAVAHVDDDLIARHLLHTVTIQIPALPHTTKALTCILLREYGRDEVLDIGLRTLRLDHDACVSIINNLCL